MKVAIPHWRGRVSPVFDVAGNVLVVEIDDGAELARQDVAFDSDHLRARAVRLAATGTEVLICGAISRPLEIAVSGVGVEVIPQTCGDVERVLAAFIEGRLSGDAFLMPGCCGRRRRSRRRRRRGGGQAGRSEGGEQVS